MTPRQILLILRLRWWLVLALFALTVVSGYVYLQLVPKRYSATTTVLLDAKADPLVAHLHRDPDRDHPQRAGGRARREDAGIGVER
jgi:hypothetical protein